MNHLRQDTSDHSQTPLQKGVVIDLEEERSKRREQVIGRRIEELMFVGGYCLFDALSKATSEFLEERNMAPVRVTGATNNSLQKRDHATVSFMPGRGKLDYSPDHPDCKS